MNIGVFDSGRGGEFVADGLRARMPEHTYIVVNDTGNVPYGSRDTDEIIMLTETALSPLLESCPIIVIACNTATMAAIETLRQCYPDIHFIGTEPMIKPAAVASRTRRATLLATPTTLRSERYRYLIESHADDLMIDEPDTSGWARAIEGGHIEEIDASDVAASIAQGSDVIVLACTHYIALAPAFQTQFPHVTVLEPTEAIARRLRAIIEMIR